MEEVSEKYEQGIGRIETNHNDIKWHRPYESTRFKMSRGTGFFIRTANDAELPRDPEGNRGRLMITCAHVIAHAKVTNTRVSLTDNTSKLYNAAIVLSCPAIDIAVLLVFLPPAAKIHTIPLGNSDELPLSAKVHVVGFPLGKEAKVTSGNFSGMSSHGLQHTSPISPGNSGCPLIYEGKVVGVNYQGETGADVSNMHYAVPINLVGVVLRDAVAASQPRHFLYRPPRIGVCFHNTTSAMVRSLNEGKSDGKGTEGGVVVHWYENETVDMLIRMNPEQTDLEPLLRPPPTKEPARELGRLTLVAANKLPPTPFHMERVSWSPPPGGKTSSDFFAGCTAQLDKLGAVDVNVHGLVKVGWAQQKVPLTSLLRRIPCSYDIILHGSFPGDSSRRRLKVRKGFVPRGGNRPLYYPFFDHIDDKLEDMYLCVMGMCLMKVHRDHLLLLRELACIPAEERNHTRFVVVRVFAQTHLQDSKIFNVGDEITTLLWDGKAIDLTKSCSDIKDLKQVLLACLRETGCLSLKNRQNRWFKMCAREIEQVEVVQREMGEYTPDPDILKTARVGKGARALRRGAARLLSLEDPFQAPESQISPSPRKPESQTPSKILSPESTSSEKSESQLSSEKSESQPSSEKPESQPSSEKSESQPSSEKSESQPSSEKSEGQPSSEKLSPEGQKDKL